MNRENPRSLTAGATPRPAQEGAVPGQRGKQPGGGKNPSPPPPPRDPSGSSAGAAGRSTSH